MQVVIATLAQPVSAQETAKGLLAVQARAQGYRCDNPISATRDAKRRTHRFGFSAANAIPTR
jgi:hypothetical protein